nr:ankyrin repeat-containing protein [Tanacetum cinerariifolium]
MTNKKVTELDVEFVEYKAKANERMDALEKKFDERIGKLDERIGITKSKVEKKFEELKQLILGRAPTQTETSKLPIKSNVYVSPPRLNETARRTYDDLGFPLPRFHADSSTTSGKNQRSDFIELKDSSKPIQWKLDDMNDDRTRHHTSFGLGFEATGFGQEFGVDPQATVDREMRHMMGTNQRGEREHGGGTNQTGDRFAYHGFKHRMRNLKMPVFEGEDAYGWIYRVERYFEIQGVLQQEQLRAAALCMEGEALSWYRWSEGRAPFPSWDGFKRRLLIRFQQSKEGNLYEQFLAITQEGSARAYVALFEKLACQLVGVLETVMEATFTKGLKPALRAEVRVMNPKGLNHAMKLAISIKDNQLFECVMQSKDMKAKGLCFRCEVKYTPGHRCASRTLQVMQVDESDEGYGSYSVGGEEYNRQLRLVLSTEDKENYLEHPIPAAPVAPHGQPVPPQALAAHAAWVKGQKEVVVLMLLTMDLEIQRNLAYLGTYYMLQELKAMYSKQVEQELLQTVREFHTSKQKEGQSVSSHVLKMKGYIDNLERLGQPVSQNLAVSLILVSLNKDFDSFMQNYNMHGMRKTVNELHAILKLHEETLPKKDANPALHAIRARRVQKNKKINRTKLLRWVMIKVKARWAMLLTMPHLLLNLRLLHHLRKITLQRTPFATSMGLRGSKKLKPGALSLYVGDGHRAAVEAIETYHLELPSGLVIVLNNCHYAPSITRGASYFITLTDDFNRYGYVYLLKHKHEVFETFKVFQKEVENQLGKTIKLLRSDRGDTRLNHEEADQEIDEPQCDINPIRKSSRTRRAPYRMCLYVDVEEHELGDLGEPANYKAALLDPESKKWLDAMNVEMQSMKDNDVWVLVELPPNAKIIGSKWLFKKKTDMDGAVYIFEARLVAKGFTQTYEVDYEETFSPVADIRAIRILIAIATYYDYAIWQMDVKTAFLNRHLSEEVYMEQPEGLVNPKYPNHNLGEEHWTAVKNILKYLRNTKDMFLVYGGNMKRELRVSCYTDAGYLKDADNLKSQTGYMFVLNGGVVDWKSTKQSIFATSSTDAEYIAAFDASNEAVWIRKFISRLGIVPTIEEPISMYCDNTEAIAIAKDDGVTKGARHFRAKVYYLCETIKLDDVKIEKIDTYDNLADPFTKALAFPKHFELTRNIGLLPASSFM